LSAKPLNKKIWASLDDFFPPEGELKVGRSFANYNFIRALWRYGSFDEYHFFLHGASHHKQFEEKHGPLPEFALRPRQSKALLPHRPAPNGQRRGLMEGSLNLGFYCLGDQRWKKPLLKRLFSSRSLLQLCGRAFHVIFLSMSRNKLYMEES
jgi:hypothetical protein